MLDIRLEGKAPIYEQLFSGVAGLISSGKLTPDERLPAVREVAKQLGINPNTVQKAYALLEQAGFIYSMPAKGSYVSPQTAAADAVRTEALRRLEEELAAAKKSGVTREAVIGSVEKIWSDDRNEGNL